MTEIDDLNPAQPASQAEPLRHLRTRPPSVPLSQGAIALFLKEKGGIRPCEACGASSWRAHREDADNASGAITFAKLDNTGMQAVAPAVYVYCGDCGLVRTFLRSIIAAWVGERRCG